MMNSPQDSVPRREADLTLRCRECQEWFSFTEGEQQFFASRQWRPPVRCKRCRDLVRARRGEAI
jgi:hypothetical protein